MVVGFNHNFSYKGQLYHVQTEDSGVKNPHIITLLYRGGTILASKKTSYADIIKVDHLDTVVEDLMKAQHREMLRLLKNGDLDNQLGLSPEGAKTPPPLPEIKPTTPATPPQIKITPPVTAPPIPRAPQPTVLPLQPVAPPAEVVNKSIQDKPVSSPSPTTLSLDDIILSYMVGEEQKK